MFKDDALFMHDIQPSNCLTILTKDSMKFMHILYIRMCVRDID